MTITRAEYMQDSSNLHRQYYGQFVNDAVKNKVLQFIGKEALLASTDEHLNDIPLKKWDALGGFIFRGSELILKPTTIEPIEISKLKEANEGVSPSTLVCIYKEAGKQLIEQYKTQL